MSGVDSTRRLIRRALDRRSEWLAFAEDGRDAATSVIDTLREQLGAGEPGAARAEFFVGPWHPDFHAYLGFLEMSELKGDQDAAANLHAALSEADYALCFRRPAGGAADQGKHPAREEAPARRSTSASRPKVRCAFSNCTRNSVSV